MSKLGVLALQGAFREHRHALERLGHDVVEVRLPRHLDDVEGLVLPGGESTTMVKLMKAYAMDEALLEFHASGRGLWGTCAGAILVAKHVVGRPDQTSLGLIDVDVERNAYGRQVDSFQASLDVEGWDRPFDAIFIRAPRLARVGPEVHVWASYAGDPVAVVQDNVLVTVFHPELSRDDRFHERFVDRLVRGATVHPRAPTP